ncbi:MAG: hypothetical protein LBO73_00680 [Holosporaceae bacterium]|nr:hypothetical protein [Holosporaceae bacterium]
MPCANFKDLVRSHPTVLFIRGTLSFPLCGLCGNVCLLLKKNRINFKTENLSENPQLYTYLREKHPLFSVPYLYTNGRFFGGYDEIMAAFNGGESSSCIISEDLRLCSPLKVWPTFSEK